MQSTYGNSDIAVKAVEYACANGADIVNCSWMFNSDNKELFDIIASYPEVLFVCAAGNTNNNLDSTEIYPASYELDNIITVTAVDNRGNLNNSSGWGKSVDIAAPGVNIISLLPEDNITYISGTSIATAFVSGVASLMLSVNDELTPSEIIEIIIRSAKPLSSLKDICFSEGIIDAYQCVLEAQNLKSKE